MLRTFLLLGAFAALVAGLPTASAGCLTTFAAAEAAWSSETATRAFAGVGDALTAQQAATQTYLYYDATLVDAVRDAAANGVHTFRDREAGVAEAGATSIASALAAAADRARTLPPTPPAAEAASVLVASAYVVAETAFATATVATHLLGVGAAAYDAAAYGTSAFAADTLARLGTCACDPPSGPPQPLVAAQDLLVCAV